MPQWNCRSTTPSALIPSSARSRETIPLAKRPRAGMRNACDMQIRVVSFHQAPLKPPASALYSVGALERHSAAPSAVSTRNSPARAAFRFHHHHSPWDASGPSGMRPGFNASCAIKEARRMIGQFRHRPISRGFQTAVLGRGRLLWPIGGLSPMERRASLHRTFRQGTSTGVSPEHLIRSSRQFPACDGVAYATSQRHSRHAVRPSAVRSRPPPTRRSTSRSSRIGIIRTDVH